MLTHSTDWLLDAALDSGYLPHAVIRLGARRQTANRLKEISSSTPAASLARKMAFIEELKTMDIAVKTDMANKQHYEVTPGVLSAALGPRMKYSACLYDNGAKTLEQAELEMLESYIPKGDFHDGQSILDVG